MKIKIKKYSVERNEYFGIIDHANIKFDPFVSGILNGKNHDREKIDSLIGKEIDVDVFEFKSGVFLLTNKGEEQFNSIVQ